MGCYITTYKTDTLQDNVHTKHTMVECLVKEKKTQEDADTTHNNKHDKSTPYSKIKIIIIVYLHMQRYSALTVLLLPDRDLQYLPKSHLN